MCIFRILTEVQEGIIFILKVKQKQEQMKSEQADARYNKRKIQKLKTIIDKRSPLVTL